MLFVKSPRSQVAEGRVDATSVVEPNVVGHGSLRLTNGVVDVRPDLLLLEGAEIAFDVGIVLRHTHAREPQLGATQSDMVAKTAA